MLKFVCRTRTRFPQVIPMKNRVNYFLKFFLPRQKKRIFLPRPPPSPYKSLYYKEIKTLKRTLYAYNKLKTPIFLVKCVRLCTATRIFPQVVHIKKYSQPFGNHSISSILGAISENSQTRGLIPKRPVLPGQLRK